MTAVELQIWLDGGLAAARAPQELDFLTGTWPAGLTASRKSAVPLASLQHLAPEGGMS